MNSNIDMLTIALGEYGIAEQPGETLNSPRIMQYFKEIGHKWVKSDETAWCSAFINWVAHMAGCEKSGKLNARSWQDVGEKVAEPKVGDIVIFWRENPNSDFGHVALFIRQTKNYIYCLGGNQQNKVCIMSYPKVQFLEYRRLKKI